MSGVPYLLASPAAPKKREPNATTLTMKEEAYKEEAYQQVGII